MVNTRSILVLAYFFLANLPSFAFEEPKNVEEVKAIRSDILKDLYKDDDNSKAVAGSYKKLFKLVKLSGVKNIIRDQDSSIALQAAWETYKKTEKRNPKIPGRTDWTFEKKSMQEFLDIFKKRTRCEIPKWWGDALLNGDVFPGRHHAFIEKGTLPERAKVTFENDLAIITLGKKNIKTLKENIEEADFFGNNSTSPVVLFGESESFFAFTGIAGYPFKASAVDTKSGKKLWQTNIWASRRGFSSGVPLDTPVEIRRIDETVIVFGIESHGAFAEGFDAKSGKCVFRFCTSYWFNFSEQWELK